jgi:hypothetical protein
MGKDKKSAYLKIRAFLSDKSFLAYRLNFIPPLIGIFVADSGSENIIP